MQSLETKPDNVICIPTNLDKFFKYWFEFLQPVHHLTPREIEVISCFTKHRYELSKVITDDEVLNRVVFGEEIKQQVKEECNLTTAHFQMVMVKLRKNNVIIENKINPKYIPRIHNEKGFKLMLLFNINNEVEQPVSESSE